MSLHGNDLFGALREHFTATAHGLGVPGAVVGVHHQGQDQFASYGVTSLEDPVPMSPDTIFKVASLSKAITATLAICLVEQGRVDLDVPVRKYMPELRLADDGVAERITMRHLLTHTGGWLDDPLMEIDDPVLHPASLTTLPQLTPLGSTWSYSTTGFFIAGRVIEHVTGMAYGRALAELLTGPLDMTRTGVDAEQAITHRVAVGHYAREGAVEIVRRWPPPKWDTAAQGVYSTPRDLIRFAQFHLDGRDSDGRRLVSTRLLEEMRSPQVEDGSRGLGWVLKEVGGEGLANHPGGLYGYACDLMVSAQHEFAIIAFTNMTTHVLDRSVLRFATEHYLSLSEPDVTWLWLPAERLQAYVGRYIGVSRDLHVTIGDGGLVVQVSRGTRAGSDGVQRALAPRPMRVALFDSDRVVGLEDPIKGDDRGQFIRDSAGSVVLFRFPTFMHVRHPSSIKLPDEYVAAHQI